MEIDFLGLNSPKYTTTMEHPPINPLTHTAKESGVETFLSLRTSTSFDCLTNILNFSEQMKKKNPNYYEKEEGSPVFLYDLNDSPGSVLRNVVSEIPSSEASSFNMVCPGGCPNVYTDVLPKKGDNITYGISKESRACMNGHRPTVAMARRATLARFLEKRLHRLHQTRTSHVRGKPHMNPNNCEGS